MEQFNASQLITVSNDSKITRDIFETLNSKLTVKEKEDFQMWLRLINYHKQFSKPKEKFFSFKKIHGLISFSIQW
jgi:hypothetical protein